MSSILVIDDDPAIIRLLKRVVSGLGHHVVSGERLQEGVAAARVGEFDLVFLDVKLPDGNGLSLLPTFRKMASRPEVIIMTGDGDPDGAETAIRNGAWDYVQKPFSPKKIELPLTRALQFRQSRPHQHPPSVALKRDGIIGESPALKQCFDLLAQAGDGDTSVLITGETGTGKELFARAVHDNSARHLQRFVVVDCTVLPETLVESALFGHRRGAFTGAESTQEGLVRQAHGGTLFLDEIGELPAEMQKAFLRVLQEKRFRALGGEEEIESDFRLVAATNRDLGRMADNHRFRGDLLYRIQALHIHLPPLRERPEDIKALALYHLGRICDRRRSGTKGIAPEVFEILQRHSWPGNVRELVNTMETALGAAQEAETISAVHLPMELRVRVARSAVSEPTGQATPVQGTKDADAQILGHRETLQAAEKAYLKTLVDATQGDIGACVRLSGLSRSRFYALLKKHGIRRKF